MQRRRSHLFLVGVILAALVGSGLLIWKKDTRLGLDLQGGLEVVLEARPPKGVKLTDTLMERSVTIMRERIDKLGVLEPEIRRQGDNQIVIQLAGVFDVETATEIIGKTAELELFDLEVNVTGPSLQAGNLIRPYPRLYDLLVQVQPQAKKGRPTAFYVFDRKTKRLLKGPGETRQDLLRQLPGRKLPKGARFLAVPSKTTVILCNASAEACPGPGEGGFIAPPVKGQNYHYLFKYDPNNAESPVPEMRGRHFRLSGTRADFDPTTGEPVVLMSFTKEGGKIFHEITRREAQRGRLRGQLQHFAIVLDKELKSFPSIDYQEYPDGIDPVNGAQITGIATTTEAKNLALVLQTGALPIAFEQVERTDVSATLGKDSLEEAERAALAGFLIVALFLLVFYRFMGLVAVIGLGIYAAFLYAAILILDVTMTLPGFAGLILTIGVAADANIVVFERIKEEVRAGKSVRAAISNGYAKGFRTIIDANVVTAITALVLFGVATATVKGFALMLLIGTVISLVTAVAATRAMLGLLAGFSWFDNPRFMGASGQQQAKWLQIDYIGLRRYWFAFSGLVLAVAIGALAVRGLNLGIDFRGGTQVTFKTARAVSLEDVRGVAKQIGRSDAVIQGRGKSVDGKYRSFQIRTKALDPPEQNRLSGALKNRYGESIALSIKNVSSSFGRQIARAAILAILVSLFLIVLYITVRFDYKFSVPVILALIHDVLITVGIYALSAKEVSTATVAAILTVLGYSIYDTIIIFDRIRENIPIMRRSPFATIANVSLWETIRRSLATTFITLLPIGSLYLFGGETLKDFAFALLVGIGAGAYSSIFIAAPLLTIWKEREPEYRRRIGIAAPAEAGVGALSAATKAAAAEPPPDLAVVGLPAEDVIADGDGDGSGDGAAAEPRPKDAGTKREQRRQRRKARPHGRSR